MSKRRVVIMGAAGRDFHNFNVYFRDNRTYEVIAFTATQIPNIEGRCYPSELAGPQYPRGIPIVSEDALISLIYDKNIEEVVFSYSDVSHEYVMHRACRVNGAGASFVLLGADQTMLKSKVPVIAICAVRTGCGKSQTTMRVSQIFRNRQKRVAVVRHPMPYGNLVKQRMQRFETYADLDEHQCTIEEREEYEPHLAIGNIIYAGVDYGAILTEAEKEADVILWDGGNNDTPFYKPNLLICVLDPHRAGHELSYYPGEVNFRTADVLVINKMDTADAVAVEQVRQHIREINPNATVIEAASPIEIDDSEIIRNKRVVVVEDGPTLTHGGMPFGAGIVASEKYGVSEIVDPRPWVTGSIKEIYQKYPKIGNCLPAMGYGDAQIKELEQSINAVDCDAVVIGTPMDLTKLMTLNKPVARVRYRLQEMGETTLEDALKDF